MRPGDELRIPLDAPTLADLRQQGGAHMNAENNAVVPRRRGQEILKEMC
jgi:hypothetical protein